MLKHQALRISYTSTRISNRRRTARPLTRGFNRLVTSVVRLEGLPCGRHAAASSLISRNNGCSPCPSTAVKPTACCNCSTSKNSLSEAPDSRHTPAIALSFVS